MNRDCRALNAEIERLTRKLETARANLATTFDDQCRYFDNWKAAESALAKAQQERDEASATLRYCEKCWQDERGSMFAQLTKAREALKRYEDWQPISVEPLDQHLHQGSLLAFCGFDEADGEQVMWTGLWGERRNANAWCIVRTPSFPRAALAPAKPETEAKP